MKMSFTPRESETPPVDQATLHILLTRAMTEMYGRVGAGAISAIGNGLNILDISRGASTPQNDDDSSRQVLLKLATSSV